MRIGLDATPAVRQGGGIGRYARELLMALGQLERPHNFRLFAASTRPLPYPLPDLPPNFSFRRLPFHDIWLARAWHRIKLPLPVELILGPLDLFHALDFALPPVQRGLPTLLTVHDLSFVRDPESAAPALRRFLEQVVPRSIRRASHVLADSASTRDDILQLYPVPANKVEVLYPGVDARFRRIDDTAPVRARYQLGEASFILSVSTLQPRKNYVRMVQAFARLPHPDLRLVIAGGRGWLYEDIFSEVRRLGLENRVHFLGFVKDSDLPALFSAARAFAYPSLYEGFGLPILEAMACGTPVLTSSVSCLPEIAGGAALLVSPLDVDAIAAGLNRLLTDSRLRSELISSGHARAAKFTWDSSARQLVSIYERLGSGNG